MSLDAFDVKSNLAEHRVSVCRAVGVTTGPSVSQVTGKGVALTRTGTGAYLLTWSDDMGVFQGVDFGLQASTPGNIAGHTVIAGAYTAGTPTLAFIVYNAADAAHDLVALEWITCRVTFSPSNVNTL